MKHVTRGLMLVALVVGASAAGAHEAHEHGGTAASAAPATQEQTLTGEVVDVFCYLSHGEMGLGKGHTECAKKCIKGGLPVAIKVGGQLYLATMADHTAANEALVTHAGQQVRVTGKVMERDGQHVIAIKTIESAN